MPLQVRETFRIELSVKYKFWHSGKTEILNLQIMKYLVFDSLGNFLRSFTSYPAASEFKGSRYDWSIISIK